MSGTPAKTSDATPPQSPLGELAATGRACPNTGWWQCADEGSVQGGRRQFFRAGERMPHVTLLGPPSLWQKLKGDTPTYRIGTVWKLMNYEASAASIEVPPTVTDSSAAPGQVPPADES